MSDKTKIADLDKLDQTEKAMLNYMIESKRIADLAAKFDISYSKTWQKLIIWEAKGWIKKIKTQNGGTRYVLDTDVIQA